MPEQPQTIRHAARRFRDRATQVQAWIHTYIHLERGSWFELLLVLLLAIAQTGQIVSRLLSGDWMLALVSAIGLLLLLLAAAGGPFQRYVLQRRFSRSHAFYIATAWLYGMIWVTLVRTLQEIPITGKDSRFFYIFVLLFIAVTYRLLLTLYAITARGYRVFMSEIPLWEQVLVAVNEFVAAGAFAYLLGGELAQFVQPQVFTLNFDIYYSGGLIVSIGLYYFLLQMMWIQRWNDWLAKNHIWVGLARLLTPLVLISATLVILKHFTRLSEPRSANLLGTANLDQTVLALSPIVWMMIFFILLIVYTGDRGVRRLLLPDLLLDHLPVRMSNPLRTISDMDILLLFGIFATLIPVQLFLFNDTTLIAGLQQQLIQQRALIDSSEQALAFIFALPFYLIALALLAVYGYVLGQPGLSAQEREALVDRLPITLLILFIITLYLAAIPFSEVLTSGHVPNLRQDLGYILAFNILIPLILLYGHYLVLIRLPYGRGQTLWRVKHAVVLENKLRMTDARLAELQNQIQQCETIWRNRNNLRTTQDERIDMLYDLIDLNGTRDRLNMERLQILDERQQLAEVSETPVSLKVARLPSRVFGIGIPLVLAFKVYEWAIVNDGLREIANNPNIGVLEFFQTILENTNF